MDENPYEPPRELNSRPTKRAGMMLAVLVVASIPAACVCGGITCYSVGVAGELSAKAFDYEQNGQLREIGWTLGIPVAIVVMVLVPVLAVWFSKRQERKSRQSE